MKAPVRHKTTTFYNTTVLLVTTPNSVHSGNTNKNKAFFHPFNVLDWVKAPMRLETDYILQCEPAVGENTQQRAVGTPTRIELFKE